MSIVSWNTRELLTDCLTSVRAAQATASDLEIEVFVVDNASMDGSAAMVQQRFPEFHLIENAKNLGFACAANIALRQATGKYVLLLNSDTILPVSALNDLCAVLDARPDAAVCGPLLLNRDGSPQLSWARFPGPKSEWSGNLDRTQSPYSISEFSSAERRSPMEPFSVDWIGAACFVIRQDALQCVGLLDEGFFFYGEEVDLCHRLQREFNDGCGKILLVPTVSVTHLGGQSSRGMPATARRHLFYSSLRLYRKLYGISRTAGFAMGLATVRYILSPLRRWPKKKEQ